jgi:hypothetical protein
MPAETVSDREMSPVGRSRAERAAGGGVVEARLAEEQHGVVARRQLLAAGLGEDAIQHRLATARLHRLHRGVYAVGHRAVSREARLMAAVLASGPGAVLSHRSAASLWGLRDHVGGSVEVTNARKSTSSPAIRRHWSTLPPDEVSRRSNIPVTTVPRTILDLASTWSVEALEAVLREAEYRRLFDRLSIPDLLRRYPGRRGTGRLRTCLARVAETPGGRVRGRLEQRFLPFLERHGLPRPRLNAWIVLGEERVQVDCLWPTRRQVLELDGWAGHGTRAAFREDRARDRRLRVAGYSVTRITWAQLDDEPHPLAADLHELLRDDGPR